MDISKEIIIITELLKISDADLAKEIDVSNKTISRWKKKEVVIENNNIEKLYNYAYSKKIYINQIYEELEKEEYENKENKILFHGAKGNILFPISLTHSKINNDFGIGFYLGENFKQASTYISNSRFNNVYSFKLNTIDLKIYEFDVSLEWMLIIAYFRGWLKKYEETKLIQDLLNKIKDVDVIIAPIADNKMFDLISEFINGYINDEQCKHALSATNLGKQYVLKSEKSLSNLIFLNKFYVSRFEKNDCLSMRLEMNKINQDKVVAARINYRNKGKYIDEILK